MGHGTGSALSRHRLDVSAKAGNCRGGCQPLRNPQLQTHRLGICTIHIYHSCADILHGDRGYKRKNAILLPHTKNAVLTRWKGSRQIQYRTLRLGYLLIDITSQTLLENSFVLKREESYTVIMLDKLIVIIIIINRVPIIL